MRDNKPILSDILMLLFFKNIVAVAWKSDKTVCQNVSRG